MTEHAGGDLGATIRAARLRAGLTLRALASGIGVSPGTMSAIENGKVAVTVDRLRHLAVAMELPVAELVDPLARPTHSGAARADVDWAVFEPLDLDVVLQAAVDVFVETGYHGATMRLVAAAADLSVAGIYRHHRGKQQLLVALVDAWFGDLLWRIDAAATAAPSPGQALTAMVRALVLSQLHRRELGFIVETEQRSLADPDRARVAGIRRGVERRFAEAAVAAVAGGEFAAADPVGGARAVVSLCLAVPFRLENETGSPGAGLADDYASFARAMMGGARTEMFS